MNAKDKMIDRMFDGFKYVFAAIALIFTIGVLFLPMSFFGLESICTVLGYAVVVLSAFIIIYVWVFLIVMTIEWFKG